MLPIHHFHHPNALLLSVPICLDKFKNERDRERDAVSIEYFVIFLRVERDYWKGRIGRASCYVIVVRNSESWPQPWAQMVGFASPSQTAGFHYLSGNIFREIAFSLRVQYAYYVSLSIHDDPIGLLRHWQRISGKDEGLKIRIDGINWLEAYASLIELVCAIARHACNFWAIPCCFTSFGIISIHAIFRLHVPLLKP